MQRGFPIPRGMHTRGDVPSCHDFAVTCALSGSAAWGGGRASNEHYLAEPSNEIFISLKTMWQQGD
jgi:hypothetical protein